MTITDTWIDELVGGVAAERNPHYHCETQSTEPCPTGEHSCPASPPAAYELLSDNSHGHYPCTTRTQHVGLLFVSVCGCCGHPIWRVPAGTAGTWHDATVEPAPVMA